MANTSTPVYFETLKEKQDIKLHKAAVSDQVKEKRKAKDEVELSDLDASSKKKVSGSFQFVEHTQTLEQLAENFNTAIDTKKPQKSAGLTESEARSRLAKFGLNQLTPKKQTHPAIKFFLQFVAFFPLLLELAGVLCLIAYGLDTRGVENLYLGIILLVVVLITAIFSFVQESKAASVMKGFQNLVPQTCKVCRNGNVTVVQTSQLVVGDIVHVKAGDKIPADLRIIFCQDLKVNNSSLTGESEAQPRSVECTDKNPLETQNLAFYTSLATEGDAIGVVIRTGDNTVLGKIANLANSSKKKDSPLTTEIKRFVRLVSIVAIVLGVVCFAISFAFSCCSLNQITQNVVFAIGIVVANVPEGLLPTITVAMTLTAKRMASKNVLVKNLESVETLGCCSVIASDKTGTLTQNVMTVTHLFYDNTIWGTDTLLSKGVYSIQHKSFEMVFLIASLCNRATFIKYEEEDEDLNNKSFDTVKIEEKKEKKRRFSLSLRPFLRKKPDVEQGTTQKVKIIGDASESALLRFCDPLKAVEVIRERFPKVSEIPFNSRNKWQLSVHKIPKKIDSIFTEERTSSEFLELIGEEAYKDEMLVVIKGAVERMLPQCSYIWEEGKMVEITEKHKETINKAYESLAANGERILGMAFAKLDHSDVHPVASNDHHNIPLKGVCFVGMITLIDPPRTTVPGAVEKCKQAGVRVAMVTGDHPLTALAIARQIGIIEEGVKTTNEMAVEAGGKTWREAPNDSSPAIVITGEEVDHLTEEEWDLICTKKTQVVFARTSPEHKLIIVKNFQKRGEIVAVTGDGVNDSPALKQANLGTAMGITGTDAAREAAHLVLLDDNFASIVNGVEEGRIVFENLKKSIAYTLSSNSPELVPFLAYITAQIPIALSAVLILCIDLGTDMVPAIALAYERPEADIMRRKPRSTKTDKLVTPKMLAYSYLWLGLFQSICAFTMFFLQMADFGIYPHELVLTSANFFKSGAAPFKGFSDKQQLEILFTAQTAFFVGLVLTRISVLLICRTRLRSIFTQGMRNMPLNIGIGVEIILCLLIVYVPGLNTVLGARPLNYKYWLMPLPFALFIVLIEEARKAIVRKYGKSSAAVKKVLYW